MPLATVRQIVLGTTLDAGLEAELVPMCEIDRAHLVMLAETNIVSRDRARAVLQEVDRLRACKFAPLRGRPVRHGLYLMYESYLIEKLGSETGGVLQTARSRNDLNATILMLRLRAPYHKLLREALRLQAILMTRGRRFSEVVMPAYTHYQAAVPITFGHYLLGIASALDRDLEALIAVAAGLRRCPLGAGAVGGTSWPIDAGRTAALLGFDTGVGHSIDAVASRDTVLRLLSAGAILGVLLSRMATDLLLWSSREFDFIDLPDDLVGGSSMMPQKRNAFLLEHVQGRSMAPLGAFVAAAGAMHSKPFTNSISVGQEAVAPMWPALDRITEAVAVARAILAHACPRPEAMRHRAVAGYTGATELANRLVRRGRMSFRSAHQAVGASLRDPAMFRGPAMQGEDAIEAAARRLTASDLAFCDGLDPASIAKACMYGSGPGSAASLASALQPRWSAHMRCHSGQTLKWRRAAVLLEDAVQHLYATHSVPACS